MTREQLEKFAHNLRNEVEREREERNFFQLERDKLRTFWEITKNQLGLYFYFGHTSYYTIDIVVNHNKHSWNGMDMDTHCVHYYF